MPPFRRLLCPLSLLHVLRRAGHAGLGINFLDQNGRGFAAQQIVEEFQARKELSKKVSSTASLLVEGFRLGPPS